MANRAYLSAPHRLLPGFSPMSAPRSVVSTSSRASPPEFSYDATPRSVAERSVGRESSNYSRAQSSAVSSAISMAYPNVNEFPYGLSGVQMPTYNFGSELYNYVSNGFPRKSRMCTFCNKVFTRSTTRRYHERRCPLLRASNSLARNEENNTATAVAAAAALKEQQQRHKEAANSHSTPIPSAPRTASSGMSMAPSSQTGNSLPSAPTPASPPPQSLHPAYPTSFPPTTPLGTNSSRSAAAAAYGYAHYGSHFYNSISAAAMASLDQNSNTLQSKKESESSLWATSTPSPSSKSRDHGSSIPNAGLSSLSKSFTQDSGIDLTAKYCSEFSLRSQPPVFPPTSMRGVPRSPSSPEPGETRSDRMPAITDRRRSGSPQDYTRSSGRENEWSSPNHDKSDYPDKITVANISGARLKLTTSSPPPLWSTKQRVQDQFITVDPVDELDEEDDEDDEENEDEVEEDEEQFKEDISIPGDDGGDDKKPAVMDMSKNHNKSSSYNPLVCQFCQKSFADTITRQAHEALHSQTKSFACSLCSNAFHCAYSLRIHFLRHHNEGPYKCKQCSKPFEEIMLLKSHLVSEHSLPKQETCSLKYFSLLDNSSGGSSSLPHNTALSDGEQDKKERNNLMQRRSADSLPDVLKHSDQTTKKLQSNETDDSPPNGDLTNEETEVCKVCNKAFAKSFIRFHERAHADQKPYECPICNKRFGYKNNMKSHMKLHQGLKPYQCQICGARFTRGSTLRRHGRRHNISRNSMLEYVLYDNTAGSTRHTGMTGKMAANPAVTTTSSPAMSAVSPQYTSYSRKSTTEQNTSFLQHARQPVYPTANLDSQPVYPTANLDLERYGTTGRRTPTKTTSQNMVSPRMLSNHLTSQALTSPMAGGLAAVAAANLFAYPATAAPHLYQFYASTNQLMGYSAYAQSHGVTPAVQSDALNLSLGKRKSPFEEEEEESKCKEKVQRRESEVNKVGSPVIKSWDKENKIKSEVEEPGEMIKREVRNPFVSSFSPKKESHINTPNGNHQDRHFDAKDELKISTEDFGAQVNICCPSPLVQYSTCSLQHQSSAGSPIGSSCNGNNIHSHASPLGLSSHGSPANSTHSAPSPNNMSEHHRQELLLSLLTSGRMFRCPFCDIYFTEYAMFRLHQKYHQCDMSRPFLCSVCGEDCKDKTYFTVHLSEHLGLGQKGGLI